jgi:hypothetical protein
MSITMHESKPDAAPFWPSAGRRAMEACSREAGAAASAKAKAGVTAVERELARYLFWGLLAALAVVALLDVGAQEALAQSSSGGGDAISQTLTSVRNYLAGLAFGIGGIGFVASLLVKAYASINENAHAYAAMGMKGSLWAIIAGAIVTPILTIAQGLAAGGGG